MRGLSSRLRDAAYAYLSRDWAGIPLALGVTLSGLRAAHAGRMVGNARVSGAGNIVTALGAALMGGAFRHLAILAAIQRRYPPPGVLVDAGGFRMHVLAEGSQPPGAPAVVWLPGGHAGSFALHHLHRMLRGEARSILVDRPGTGWSEAGPFPRSTARERDEIVAALGAAGESGPFVFVGHSFGGLLAANIARRHPALTAAVILLDATPLDTIVYGPRLAAAREMTVDAARRALFRLFGFHGKGVTQTSHDTDTRRIEKTVLSVLGPAYEALENVELAVRSGWTAVSIYDELTPQGVARVAGEIGLHDGDLEDTPTFVVAPADVIEFATMPEAAQARMSASKDSGRSDAERLLRFYLRTRERYMAVSTTARRVYSPAGTGHNFPYEAPEFTAGVVRAAIALSSYASSS